MPKKEIGSLQPRLFEISPNGEITSKYLQPKNPPQGKVPDPASLIGKVILPPITVLSGKDKAAGEGKDN